MSKPAVMAHDSVEATDIVQRVEASNSWPRIDVDWSAERKEFFRSKYTIERTFGCILLIGFAPIIGVLWLLVRLTSRGPGFYQQVRVGLNGKCFNVVKLRSMRQNAEQAGQAVWCQRSDRRVTWLGIVLRKLHLDELPQLWNVAKGEMSLVGPRPERPEICEKLAKKISGYYDRVLVKPGISGLSQINLPADQSLADVQRKQILDLHYINTTNRWFEIRILLATALRIFGLSGETIIGIMRLSRRALVEQAEPVPQLNELTITKLITRKESQRPQDSKHANPLTTLFDESSPTPDSTLGGRTRVATAPTSSTRTRRRLIKKEPRIQRTNPQATVTTNCLTVDVEDYFQVSAFADRVTKNDWDNYECRVEKNTDQVLSIFDNAHVRGTFFVLGWVADRYPKLVQRIAAAGHEVASHGYWHQLVYDLSPEQFANDVIASRDAIYNACGVEVTAYRAPSFSITPRSRWALDILCELGFKTDSSIFPVSGHDRYGDPDAEKSIHVIATDNGKITEVPPTMGYANRIPVPIGGGYFRLYPLRMTQQAIDNATQQLGHSMLYLHPWELDPDQPRLFSTASRKNKFRHYVGLKRTESKLIRLLDSHHFSSMENVVDSWQSKQMQHEVSSPSSTLKLIRRDSNRSNFYAALPSGLTTTPNISSTSFASRSDL